jgi:hypothetical protein
MALAVMVVLLFRKSRAASLCFRLADFELPVTRFPVVMLGLKAKTATFEGCGVGRVLVISESR